MKLATTDLCDEHFQDLKIAQPIGFKDFGGKTAFGGEIVTIKTLDNNPLVRKTLGVKGNRRVLVIDGEASVKCALMGDNIAELAVENGWEGVVINGCIRDSKAIKKLNLGVKALTTIPIKSGKNDVGELNVEVSFAGITFVPGEFIYCDEDGIVVSKENYFNK